MRSPYEAPKSDLYSQKIEKRSIWWKVYFYFICSLFILNAISTFTNNEINAYDYLSNAVNFICALGLFGFVYNRKIFIMKFWFIFSFFAALENLMGNEIYEQTFNMTCLLYTSPSPRDLSTSRMPSSA